MIDRDQDGFSVMATIGLIATILWFLAAFKKDMPKIELEIRNDSEIMMIRGDKFKIFTKDKDGRYREQKKID